MFRGNAKLYLEDYQGAIVDYSKALEINHNDAFAYNNRGIAKFEIGQKESGCLDLSKAGELGFKDAYKVISEKCTQYTSSKNKTIFKTKFLKRK